MNLKSDLLNMIQQNLSPMGLRLPDLSGCASPKVAPDRAQILDRKSQFFDRWAPHYDILFTTIFYQAIHKRLLESIATPPAAPVLDLGCGTGRLLGRLGQEFPEVSGIGLDLSPEMVQQAAARNCYPDRFQFQVGEASQLPFGDATFATVFNTLSFLHYPDPQAVFQEVCRILVPGGQFYLVDIAPSFLNTIPFSPNGIRFYSRQQREDFGTRSGLHCQGHTHLLGNVLLSRFIRL